MKSNLILKSLLFILLVSCNNINSSKKVEKNLENEIIDGKGTIKYTISREKTTYQNVLDMGAKVWRFTKNYPEAMNLDLIITNRCIDNKGNISYDQSIVKFDKNDLNEFSTYANVQYFGKSSYYWGLLVLNWHPCGKSLNEYSSYYDGKYK